MFEYLDSPDHLIAMKVSGTITAEEVDAAYKRVEEHLAKHDRISFFAEVPEGFSFTWDGLLKDLVQSVSELGRLSRYYRAAIVTESGWLAALERVEGLVFSSIDVRVFPVSERDKAFAWASEKPEPRPAVEIPQPSIRFIQTTNDRVFAWEVNGRIREQDIKNAVEEMKPYLEREGKMNALVRMRNYDGFDLMAVLDDQLVKMKYKALGKFERYAVIGPKPWMRNFLELVGGLISTEVRVFEEHEESAAWEWVGAQQALLPE
jgi:hypothetical protein